MEYSEELDKALKASISDRILSRVNYFTYMYFLICYVNKRLDYSDHFVYF